MSGTSGTPGLAESVMSLDSRNLVYTGRGFREGPQRVRKGLGRWYSSDVVRRTARVPGRLASARRAYAAAPFPVNVRAPTVIMSDYRYLDVDVRVARALAKNQLHVRWSRFLVMARAKKKRPSSALGERGL